jgi:hypothetical protein
MDTGAGTQEPPEKTKKSEVVVDSGRRRPRFWPFTIRRPTVDELNTEVIEADICGARIRVERIATGTHKDSLLSLLDKASEALKENKPKVLFSRRLVEVVKKSIRFRSTALPYFSGLAILLFYFAILSYLTYKISLAPNFGTAVLNVALSFTMGALGGSLSLALDFAKIFTRLETRYIAIISVTLRPLIGGVLAAFLFSLIASAYLNELIPPLIQVSFNELPPTRLFHTIISMSFLFGFSERIPASIIQRAEQQVVPQ